MFKRRFDEEAGFIRVEASGVWTPDEVEQHIGAQRELIAKVRERGLPIRVLIDIRGAPRQTPEIEKQFGEGKEGTYRPGDRVAILTATQDDKHHVRTLLNGAQVWSWASELAAEQWLLLDEPGA